MTGTRDQGYEKAIEAYRHSIANLGIEKADLYLIHWPGASSLEPSSPENRKLRFESWHALCDLYKRGEVAAIGISNFTVRHMEELLNEGSFGIVPMVNQMEFHPRCYNRELIDFCKKHNIFLQGYSSLGRGELVRDAAVVSIAEKYRKTTAQVLLRWSLQHGVGVLPKSATSERIRENIDVFDFELDANDMKTLDGMSQDGEHHYCWNPYTVA